MPLAPFLSLLPPTSFIMPAAPTPRAVSPARTPAASWPCSWPFVLSFPLKVAVAGSEKVEMQDTECPAATSGPNGVVGAREAPKLLGVGTDERQVHVGAGSEPEYTDVAMGSGLLRAVHYHCTLRVIPRQIPPSELRAGEHFVFFL
ncbi:hypothetical protein MSAN_01301000 [Mycena sanguinolenta]|uniref:Uncharacterized protein n=1 Tax=Mycena sanguinolenta TaxID=230812 RepID=A0A8H7D0I9_9AGAR|nr:hypothetical protein MSAN_01301000 [Mycena sanguinolenta]